MRSLPGCWRLYGELMVRVMGRTPADPTYVDCYAAQHPGGAETERRQRQSVAVHLVALCAFLEHGVDGPALLRLRGSLSERVLPAAGLDDWPLLSEPGRFGSLNAPVLAALDDDALDPALSRWAQEIWQAWSDHHDVVRHWAGLALRSRRG